jgi:hypothetical protein
VSSNNDWFNPAGNAARNVLDDDGFTENSAAHDVANGTVRRFPHLLEVEFFDTGLIRCDGSALNTDFASLDSFSAIDCDLIVGGVTVFDAKVVVLNVEVQVGENELYNV